MKKIFWVVFALSIIPAIINLLRLFSIDIPTSVDNADYFLNQLLFIVVAALLIKQYPNNRPLQTACVSWLVAIGINLAKLCIFKFWSKVVLANGEVGAILGYVGLYATILTYTALLLMTYSSTSAKPKLALSLIIAIGFVKLYYYNLIPEIIKNVHGENYLYQIDYYEYYLKIMAATNLFTEILWAWIFAMMASKELFRNEDVSPLPIKRNLLKMITLGFLTCGAYPIYVFTALSHEINTIAKNDGRKTMNYMWVAWVFSWLTLGILPLIWMHRICCRMNYSLAQCNSDYEFGAKDFWLWGVLGSVIAIGPFVFIHKIMKASNILNNQFNQSHNLY